MGMSFPFFIAIWLAMMAAMMLPAIGPAASIDGRIVGGLAFSAGFLMPWALYGVAAFGVFAAAGRLVEQSPAVARWLGVGFFAVAGIYQFTPWKRAALEHCRALMHRSVASPAVHLSAGLRDGAVCVGCCWALMTTLVAVGAMNLFAMAGLSLIIFAEKILPRPRQVAAVAGLALIAFAVIAAIEPSILHGLTPADGGIQMHMPSPMNSM
jgi:predicted metal-binding membrane protein